MTSTGHTPIDHTDRWASARREQGEETEVGKIGPTNRATDQVLVTPDRSEALIRCLTTGKDPGLMMPRAGRDSRLHSVGTSVYLYYDAHGTLIYVGITDRGMTRNYEHNLRAEWWRFVARQEVEHYPTREDALDREKSLILLYLPPFNRQHNPRHEEIRSAYLRWQEIGLDDADPHIVMDELNRNLPFTALSIGSPERFILRTLPEHSAVATRLTAAEGVPVLSPRLVGRVESMRKSGAFTFLLIRAKRAVPERLDTAIAVAPVRFVTQNPPVFRLAQIELHQLASAKQQARRLKDARRSAPPSPCDRATCKPGDRCPEHRIDVDPPTVGDILRGLAGGGR